MRKNNFCIEQILTDVLSVHGVMHACMHAHDLATIYNYSVSYEGNHIERGLIIHLSIKTDILVCNFKQN